MSKYTDNLNKLLNTALRDFYEKAFNNIQSLGDPGLHSENLINRQDALNELKKAYIKVLDS